MILSLLAFGLGHAAAQAPIRVACVGDSITWGAGTKDPAVSSYPAQLQRLLGTGYKVGNFGKPWATLAKTGDVPFTTLPEYGASSAFLPNIVVIMLGTNDARPVNWDKSMDVFVPHYKELIAHYRGLSTHPQVFVCWPPPTDQERQFNVVSRIIPLVTQVAREAHVGLIDLYSPLEGKPELLEDNLHPKEEGAALMAEAVAEAIEDPAGRKKAWKVVSVDSQEPEEGPAGNAIDGDPNTYWHTNYSSKETRPPHEIVVDMGSSVPVAAFRYLPRQDGGINGRVRGFELYLSEDGSSWGKSVLEGEMKNTAGWTTVRWPSIVKARFFRFRALSEWHGGPWTSAAELDVRRAVHPQTEPLFLRG